MLDAGSDRPFSRRPLVWAMVFGGLLVLGVVASIWVFADPPDDLPGVALGSPELLHLLRGGLVGAAAVLLLIFLVNGAQGRWPDEIALGAAGFKYNAPEQDAKLATEVDSIGQQVDAAIDDIKALKRTLDEEGARVSEHLDVASTDIEQVWDLANRLATWAADEEGKATSRSERLASFGERIAWLEGHVGRPATGREEVE